MRKYVYFVVASLILVIVLYFFKNDKLSENTENINSTPRYGGTLVVGIANDLDTFNPLFSESAISKELIHLVQLGLADLDEKSEFLPEIAASWERSKDFYKLTYHLRNDATWQDGAPITAFDVKFTFELLKDTTVASPLNWVTEYINHVEVIDSQTVVFIFDKAYPDQIFDTAGEILPRHILKNAQRNTLRNHNIGRMPLSSGPFKLRKWESQQYIELERNDNYFGKKPYLDKLLFKIIPDKTSRLLQLKNGEIDMMMGVPAQDAQKIKQTNQNIKIHATSGRAYYYVGYNNQNKMFNNKTVRKALTMALDRHKIIEALLFGFGKPCTGHVPPIIHWAFNSEIKEIQYSSELAVEILKQEGWIDRNNDGWLDKNSKKFKFTLLISAGSQLKTDVALVIQDQLKKVGIDVEIETIEWSALSEKLHKHDFDSYIGGWNTALNVDLTPVFHSSATNLYNYVSYSNPEVDKLIEKGREELNREKSAVIWKEVQELIYDDQPYTFLFWIDNIVAVNSKFMNVTPIPLSAFYDIENWYKL